MVAVGVGEKEGVTVVGEKEVVVLTTIVVRAVGAWPMYSARPIGSRWYLVRLSRLSAAAPATGLSGRWLSRGAGVPTKKTVTGEANSVAVLVVAMVVGVLSVVALHG
jgi:hypothetical protein